MLSAVPVLRPERPRVHAFPPSAWPFVLSLALALGALALLLLLDVISFAYERLGLGERSALLLLAASLLGGTLNVPVWRLAGERVVTTRVVSAFGVRYLVPVVREQRGTLVAINVGGAVIPSAFSLWVLVRTDAWWQALVAALALTIVVHRVARPVPGLGIAVPALVPPLFAALLAVALAGSKAAPVAYAAGTFGTLLGADLTNLGRLRGLGAPVASIGGAGTFDAVFLSGVMAVTLAALL